MKCKDFCLFSALLIVMLLSISCKQTVTQEIVPTTSAITTATVQSSSENKTNSDALTTISTSSLGFKFPNASNVENRFGVQDAFPGLQFSRLLTLKIQGMAVVIFLL
jgi:hypothetical protein